MRDDFTRFASHLFIHSLLYIPQASVFRALCAQRTFGGKTASPQPRWLAVLCLRIFYLLSSNLFHRVHVFIYLRKICQEPRDAR